MQIYFLTLFGIYLIFDVINSLFTGETLSIMGAGTVSHMSMISYQLSPKWFIFAIVNKLALALLFIYNFFTKDKKKNK